MSCSSATEMSCKDGICENKGFGILTPRANIESRRSWMEKKGQFYEMENLLRIKMDKKAIQRNLKAIKLNGHSPTTFSKAGILPTASLNLIDSYNSILNQTADILLPSQGLLNHWNAGWKKKSAVPDVSKNSHSSCWGNLQRKMVSIYHAWQNTNSLSVLIL